MEFHFASRQPESRLSRYVESMWYAHGRIDYPRELIAPTGSTVAVIILGAPITEIPDNGQGEPYVATDGFLLGPHDRPVINEPHAETHCLGVVTTPIGCRAVFGTSPGPLRGRAVGLSEIWPAGGAVRTILLMDGLTADVDFCLDLVEQTVTAGLTDTGPAVDRCEQAVRALESDPLRPVAEVAAELGISHGHLDREFGDVVGLSPRTVSRILRMRALLARLDVFAPIDWSGLAADFGWYDQSHFIRDFRRHTGVSPSGYVAAQRAIFTPQQADPGFVPQGLAPPPR